MRKTKTIVKIVSITAFPLILGGCEKKEQGALEKESSENQHAKLTENTSVSKQPKEEKLVGNEEPLQGSTHSDPNLRPALEGTGIQVPELELPDYAAAVVTRLEKKSEPLRLVIQDYS